MPKEITACVTFKVIVGVEVGDPANLTDQEIEVITDAALESMSDKWEADDVEVIDIEGRSPCDCSCHNGWDPCRSSSATAGICPCFMPKEDSNA